MTRIVPMLLAASWLSTAVLMGCAAERAQEAPRQGAARFQAKDPFWAEIERRVEMERAAANDPVKRQCQIPEDEARMQAELSLSGANRGAAALDADTLPFGADMTRPEKIAGPIPQYPAEALKEGIEGLMIVKCVITHEGTVRQCRTLKSLPYLEGEVLRSLYCSRWKPVTFQGTPRTVDYTFNIKITKPR